MLSKLETQQLGACKHSHSSTCEPQNCGVKKHTAGYCGGYVENRFGVGAGMLGSSGLWLAEHCARKRWPVQACKDNSPTNAGNTMGNCAGMISQTDHCDGV